MISHIMTKRCAPIVVAGVMTFGACEDLTVPDFNNPGIGELTENPTRSGVITAAQGLMIGARNGIAARAGYVSELGVLGRESYNFDPSDPRFVTELLQGPLDPGSNAFGGAHWVFRYNNIRNATIVLNAVEAAAAVFSTEEQEGIRGFAKTIQALDFLKVINTRGDFGAPIDVGGDDPTGDPAPIATETEVFARITQLLDEAAAHFDGAGGSFAFQLSSGFANFNTPAGMRQVGRALRARVDVYQGRYTDALSALTESFLNDGPSITLAGLETGVYHAYSTAPGDVTNAIFDPSRLVIVAHPSAVTDAQTGDQRLDRKVVQIPEIDDQSSLGVTTEWAFDIYESPSAHVPIIRNEELILLRAEANLGAGNVDAALADVNLIRTQSGALPLFALGAWQALTDDQRLDELLYNKRYSLLFEGHRWMDLRRYDRLTGLPQDHSTFLRFNQFPFPQRECDPRSPTPDRGCSQVQGF